MRKVISAREKCIIRKAVQLCLVLWREEAIRRDFIEFFYCNEGWNTEDAGIEKRFVTWLGELEDRNEGLNIIHVIGKVLGD